MLTEKRILELVQALERGTLSKDESDEELAVKISAADDLIRLYGPGKDAMKMLREKFEISQTYAYSLITAAQRVFGSQCINDKKYWRGLLIEKAYKRLMVLEARLENIRELEDEKEKGADPKYRARRSDDAIEEDVYKLYLKCLEMLKDLTQLDKPDLPFDPRTTYTPPILTANPEDVGISRVNINQALEERLLSLGAKKDEHGNFQ